jgi:hypothetical protein
MKSTMIIFATHRMEKFQTLHTNIPEGSKQKADMVEVFFKYLHDEVKVKNGIYMSADVFGDVSSTKRGPRYRPDF